jgi:hypothetical protein
VDTAKIVHELDAEIARLTSARKILGGESANARYNGRLTRSAARRTGSRKRRSGLTAAGRKRLSELMKKRWAERRKKAAGKAK